MSPRRLQLETFTKAASALEISAQLLRPARTSAKYWPPTTCQALAVPFPRGPHTPGIRDRLGPQPPGEDPQQGCPAERPKDPAGAAQASYRSA